MAELLEGVNQRTRLVGRNRLELLLFKLGDGQHFAINVFKVREAIHCPSITPVPNAHPVVRGIAYLRNHPIPIIDLCKVLGRSHSLDPQTAYVIVTEFNRRVQGFLVDSVDRIVNMNWEGVLPPPRGLDSRSYMTAVTYCDGELIQILDVEKILSEVIGDYQHVAGEITDVTREWIGRIPPVLVVDDSSVARNQVKRCLSEVGLKVVLVSDGKKALEQLRRWSEDGRIMARVSMLISDIEMPQMDGYTLCTRIRQDDKLKDLFVMLHSSLSGVFNESMVKRAGADDFMAKFATNELSTRVLEHTKMLVDSGLIKPQ